MSRPAAAGYECSRLRTTPLREHTAMDVPTVLPLRLVGPGFAMTRAALHLLTQATRGTRAQVSLWHIAKRTATEEIELDKKMPALH